MTIHVGSALEAEADAIVNAANTELRHGGGVARAIAVAAGPDFDGESRRVAPCPLGDAVVTGAGRLRYRRVIHVPTLEWSTGRRATADELVSGAVRALQLAVQEGCRSVAFPLLGAGIAGMGARPACAALAEALTRAAAIGPVPERVIVCAFTAAEQVVAAEVFAATAFADP